MLDGTSLRSNFGQTLVKLAHTQGGEATKMEEGEFFAIETFGTTGGRWW